jgi:pyruvate,water dikinase
VSEEAADALREIRCDPDAVASLRDGPFDDVLLAELCGRFPAVRAYVELVTPRLVDGFDVDRPTLGECPEVLLGKLAAGLDADPAKVRARSDAFAASLRVRVPEPLRLEFDALLAAARSVYRLRDERGVYSDIPAVGLLRLAMLEIGRRAVDAGLLDREEDALDADADELVGLAGGAANGAVTSVRVPDLAGRASARIMHAVGGAPRYLGDPPPPHPPVELLPPPLGRVMAAVGFMIDGILGESEHASGSDDEIGGITGNGGVYEGTARLIASADDLFAVEPGEVLVVAATGESFNAFLHLVGAVVTDHGSFASHAAIMARELGFPAVVGTVDATTRVHTGDRVVVDGDRGLVRVLRRAG